MAEGQKDGGRGEAKHSETGYRRWENNMHFGKWGKPTLRQPTKYFLCPMDQNVWIHLLEALGLTNLGQVHICGCHCIHTSSEISQVGEVTLQDDE